MNKDNALVERREWDEFWMRVDPQTYIQSMTYHDRILLEYFMAVSTRVKPARLLELGCVNSKTLYRLPPATDSRTIFFGLDPAVDALRNCKACYDSGRVLLAGGDLFDAPLADDSFDIVSSFGLIEHYLAPQPFLESCLRLLRPGGILIAGYPSFQGITGWLQQRVNHQALDHHYSLSAAQMATEFARAGLIGVESRYFGLFNPNMIDWGKGKVRRGLMYCFFAANRPFEWLARLAGIKSLPGFISSYVIAAGQKPS